MVKVVVLVVVVVMMIQNKSPENEKWILSLCKNKIV